ncbi:MAG TPA: hypothetical protein VN736_25580 [Candidatus Limnocylindrales bacterium]|nr:hypothetical protein [Candidatus Limnocylindrales bacterium]
MRGPALLLLTFVVAMPTGRAFVEGYLALATARFASQSPLSEIFAAMAVIALLLLAVVMRQGKPKAPQYLVSRETRGAAAPMKTLRAAPRPQQ